MTAQTGAFILSTNGSMVRTITTSAGFMNACCVDEVRNELFVANNQGLVYRCSEFGSIIASRDFGAEVWSGLDIHQDKPVHVATTGASGSRVTVGLNFPDSPTRSYCCALSLSQRPYRFGTNNYLNPGQLTPASRGRCGRGLLVDSLTVRSVARAGGGCHTRTPSVAWTRRAFEGCSRMVFCRFWLVGPPAFATRTIRLVETCDGESPSPPCRYARL